MCSLTWRATFRLSVACILVYLDKFSRTYHILLLQDTDSKITYAELLQMVCRIANYLKSIGVKKGDDVTIYMPMVMELPAAMVGTIVHACSKHAH